MTNVERVLDFIRRWPGRDDDEIARALGITPRQTVNQICRKLSASGSVERRPNETGKLGNFIAGRATERSNATEQPSAPRGAIEDATAEWFWEGRVTESLVTYFRREGWTILAQADTLSKQQGIDLHVHRGFEEQVIEVKGYSSTLYRDPRRAGEKKPTNPAAQASHWFAHALLKTLRLRSSYTMARPMMAFPDRPRYRALHGEIAEALGLLGIGTLFVRPDGEVDMLL